MSNLPAEPVALMALDNSRPTPKRLQVVATKSIDLFHRINVSIIRIPLIPAILCSYIFNVSIEKSWDEAYHEEDKFVLKSIVGLVLFPIIVPCALVKAIFFHSHVTKFLFGNYKF